MSCDVSELEFEYHHHDAGEDRGDPSVNVVDIPFGRALLHHVYPMKNDLDDFVIPLVLR